MMMTSSSLNTNSTNNNKVDFDISHVKGGSSDDDDDDDLPSMQESLCSITDHDTVHTASNHPDDDDYESDEHDHDHEYEERNSQHDEEPDYSFSELKMISDTNEWKLKHNNSMAYYSSIFPDASTIYSSTTDSRKKKKSKQQQQQQQQSQEEDDKDASNNNNNTILKHRMERIRKHFPLPKSCEYCGAKDHGRCNNNNNSTSTKKCQRPSSFFQSKRPPFGSKGSPRWNPKTDEENPKVENIMTTMNSSSIVLREWDYSKPTVTEQMRSSSTSIMDVSAEWIASWWG